jgi:arylsulfatase A-like enzyme
MILRGIITFVLAAVASSLSGKDNASPRPNIVFILADDLGWADVGFNGPDIRTPNIDRLAAGGARLHDFYMQPLCSPSRASLMTGRYPIRYGLQVGVVRPWARYGLPLEERTLPRALDEAGYLTAIFGKWHLGHFQRDYLPMERGFSRQYGMYNGAIDYFKHLRDGGLDWHRDEKACYDEGYTTDLLARESVDLIQHQDGRRPFFLYAAFNAPHAPFQAPPKYSAPYGKLPGQRRVYAGMVAALDEAVGRIVAAVEKKGLRANTIFIFSSDNGGPSPGEITSNGPFRAGKGTVYEGGTRVAACVTWDGHIPAGSVVTAPLHAVDWYPTLVKLAGGSLQQKLPLDGRDAWPCIAQGQPSPHDAILINTSPQNGAIRGGDWKLVRNGNLVDAEEGGPALPAVAATNPGAANAPGARGDLIELFNLALDPGETTNLAARYPEKVKELQGRLEIFQREAVEPKISGVKPPGYIPPKIWGEWD